MQASKVFQLSHPMLSSDQNVEQITKLVGEAKDYVKLRGKLWRLLFIEKSSVLLSGLLTAVLALVLCFFAVGMLSVCAALLLSPVVGSLAGACAIVAAAYLVVLLIVYLNRTNWIVNPVTSFVARTIINAYIYKEGPGFLQQEKNVITLPLKKHVNLNGTFFFDGWNPTLDQTGWITGIVPHGTIPSLTTDNTIPLPNKLYTSEINNPFYFPTTSIVTIGTGTILGMSTASKALSQGQFGQFPLYVFTTDGVWALEVSSAGTFYARQPITRDICTNPDSITQLDSAVIFATDRGLMLLQGSEAICVTDGIATEHPFNVLTKLPHAADLHAMLDHNADTCLPTQPFLAFLSGCRIIYDYVHQHIIVFNTNYTYAYVFSLKSKLWGMMYSNLASTLNSYPNALAMSQDNHLVSFSDTDQDICKGLLITRPLKLGDGDTLKSIHTLLQRGNFQRGDVNTVLYGSRDLVNWHIIATSVNHEIRNLRGTPYKYFRVASVATLTPDKSIYGITVDVEPRHTSVLQ